MPSELQTLLTTNLFAWLLVFTRVGTAFVTLPGVGEVFISTRIRLLFALAFSLVLVPPLAGKLPPMPSQTFALLSLIIGEAFYGAFIGLLARLIMATVETAGMIIAMQMSLSNASVFNPAMAAQSSLTSALLGMLALVLLFVTDMHHLLFMAVTDSYSVFIPGQMPDFGDFANAYSEMMSQSFSVATQLAAPFIILGLIFYLGLGMLARLMPQLQIFFIAIPAQIYLGFMLMGITLSAVMMMWLQYAQSTLQGFLDVR